MKKLIIFLAIFLASGVAFAEDTNLGKVDLTDKQLTQAESLKDDVIKGFSIHENGIVVVVSTRALSAQEKSDLVKNLKALPDEYTKFALEQRFDSKVLMGDVYQSLEPASTLKLAPYTGAMQSMMDWKNFSGIKGLIDGLVALGIMTSEEQTIVYQCFLNQGIDLTEY